MAACRSDSMRVGKRICLFACLALALVASTATSVVELRDDATGLVLIGFTQDEVRRIAAIFALQRSRIAQLESELREMKAGNGCI